jgi:iron complex outermembrane receptor protein
VRVAAVDSPAARLAGATDLRPETARNFSAGLIYERGGLTATLDAYRIAVKDRIAISSTFQDARLTNFLAANGQGNFSAISYVTNAVDTTTEGLDLVVSYRHEFADSGRLTGTLAGNVSETEFDRIAGTPPELAALGLTTPLFDLTQQLRFSDSLPGDKITLDLDYARGPFSVSLTNTRYGEVSTVALTNRTPAHIAALTPGYDVRLVPVGTAGNADIVQTFGAEWLTNLEVSWEVSQTVRISLGTQNVFDVYPDENIASTVASVAAGTNGADNARTQRHNAVSPFGFNGRSMFVRLGLNF